MPRKIESFEGRYAFLSNSYEARVLLDGIRYPTVEHAFQAARTTDREARARIKEAETVEEAREISAEAEQRPEWDEDFKKFVMRMLLRRKFKDPALRARLLATGDAELGSDLAGRLLMCVREEIQYVSELEEAS